MVINMTKNEFSNMKFCSNDIEWISWYRLFVVRDIFFLLTAKVILSFQVFLNLFKIFFKSHVSYYFFLYYLVYCIVVKCYLLLINKADALFHIIIIQLMGSIKVLTLKSEVVKLW